MILARRRLELPQFGAHIGCDRLVGRSFQLKVWDIRGVVLEEGLQDPSWRTMVDAWPTLVLTFHGGGCVRSPWQTAWVGEHTFTADPPNEGRGGGLVGRIHDGTRVLVLQWDPSVWGGTTVSPDSLPMAQREAHRLDELTQAAVTSPAGLRAAAVGRVAAALRAWGLSLNRDIPLEEDADASSARDQALVDAAYAGLSELGANPTVKDFAATLGVSEPHAHRLLARIPDRVGPPAGWRELKRRTRLSTGLALMTSPLATTEAVAAALGYSSPTAFCRAMAQAGLPSPGAIRRRVAEQT